MSIFNQERTFSFKRREITPWLFAKRISSVQEKVSKITEMMSLRIWKKKKKGIVVSTHKGRLDLEGPTVFFFGKIRQRDHDS